MSLKKFEEYRIKTDDEIEEEYTGYTIQEFKYEARDMSFAYSNGAYEAMVVWQFKDETIGGYEESVEDVIYTTIPNSDGLCFYKYAINNWYPESVYLSMESDIESKLKEKYGHDFERTTSLESN